MQGYKLMNEENEKSGEISGIPDDLQQIRGVAAATARALNNLGILRFADLARYTPAKLARLLKPELSWISAKRIDREDWTGQASKLAHAGASEGQSSEKKEAAQEVEAISNHPSWQRRAEFTIFFDYKEETGERNWRTTVYHDETGEEIEILGYEPFSWVEWISRQGNLPLAEQPLPLQEEIEALPLPAETPSEDAVHLEVSQLWVREAKVPVAAGGELRKAVLRAESRLILSGPAAVDLTRDHNPLLVELYLVDTESKESERVASYRNFLVPGTLTYDLQQDFPIPQAGHYQLFLIASLLPPGAMAVHIQGPFIRVEL